jgi:hypothetical protein
LPLKGDGPLRQQGAARNVKVLTMEGLTHELNTHAWGSHGWKTIRYALDDGDRTVRLCVILLTIGAASSIPILFLALAHAYFGL